MSSRVQKAQRRGIIDFNWGKGHHYFSFGHFYNPLQLNYGALNVLSHYKLEKVEQFEKSTLKDMDIVTVLLKGQMRQNNSIEDRIDFKENQALHISSGNQKEITYQIQNANDTEIAEFVQIYLYKDTFIGKNLEEEKEDAKFNLVDFDSSKVNQEQILVETGNSRVSIVYIEEGKEIKLEQLKGEKYGYYIALLEGDAEITEEGEGKKHIFESGDVLIKNKNSVSVKGLQQKVSAIKEIEENKKQQVSKVLVVQTDLTNHLEFQQL